MAYAVALSQMNGVKPLVVDSTFKAMIDLHNGNNVDQTLTNMQDNINDQLKFQYFIDNMKPLYDNLIEHLTDGRYTLYVYNVDDADEDMIYKDDDYCERQIILHKKRNDTFLKINQEVVEWLTGFGLVEDCVSREQIKSFVNDFYNSQTRAYDFYEFCKLVYKDNKQANAFDKAPVFVVNHDTKQFVTDLDELANSSLVYMLDKTNSFDGLSVAVRDYINKIDTIIRSKEYLSFCKNQNFRGKIKTNIPPVEAMMQSLVNCNGELDKPSTEFVDKLNDIAKTLFFERTLSNKILQAQKMGANGKRLKVYLQKEKDGSVTRHAIFNKGDLLHMAKIKDDRLDSILNDNCLLPYTLQDNKFVHGRYGDASVGGVHCLHVPVDFSDMSELDKKSQDRKRSYFHYCATSTYNDGGETLGFVFDKSVAQQNQDFEQMHFLENFVVDERREKLCKNIKYLSANYYSYVMGAMNEKERLIYDKCYFLGMPLSDIKCLTMFDGSWSYDKIKQDQVEQVKDKIGNNVPFVVNGVLVNEPSPEKIEVVKKSIMKTSEAEDKKKDGK